jgi:DNA-binding transcriptional LysR family regulator
MQNRQSDWNDAFLLLTVIRCGSFLRAAAELGCDQATVSRRVAALEKRAGHPLFHRRTTGAVPTAAARPLIEAAEAAASAIGYFDRLLAATGDHSQPVSVSCPEGLASYVIAPCLSVAPGSLPLGLEVARPLPRLNLVPLGSPADVSVLLVEPGQPVPTQSDMRVRRIGRLRFTLIAGIDYLRNRGAPDSLAELSRHSLLQHAVYDVNPAFTMWTDIVHSGAGPVLTTSTSSGLHRAALGSTGMALLPNFAPLLDPMVSIVSCGLPVIPVDIWLAAHPDTLRLPSVRAAYDSLVLLLETSTWLRAD